jgi:hypothetical protein
MGASGNDANGSYEYGMAESGDLVKHPNGKKKKKKKKHKMLMSKH